MFHDQLQSFAQTIRDLFHKGIRRFNKCWCENIQAITVNIFKRVTKNLKNLPVTFIRRKMEKGLFAVVASCFDVSSFDISELVKMIRSSTETTVKPVLSGHPLLRGQ